MALEYLLVGAWELIKLRRLMQGQKKNIQKSPENYW